MTSPTHQLPTQSTETSARTTPARLRDVDALRGFALFGILVVNIAFFATAYPWHGIDDPAYASTLDGAVRATVVLLFELKFYLLFSFLFGYSFTLQLASAERRGAAFVPRFLRRLAGLFLLGAAHALLFFHGDILTTYALLGVVLLLARRIRPRTALIWAGVLIGLVALQLAGAALTGASLATDPAAALAEGRESTEALAGSPATVIGEHLRSMPQMLLGLASLQAPIALAAFLVGLAAGKRAVLADGDRHTRLWRVLCWVGYPVGLAGAVLFASTGGTTGLDPVALAVTVVTAPLLAAAYVATLYRIFPTRAGGRLSRALAPAGRMALSNYLGQSVICAIVFTGWGFGLIGHVSPLAAVGIAAAIFAAQVVASDAWLRRHHYGPVEWLLRALTNAALPPWRRVEGA
ncbi:DUF418 domain-containing protein [Micromonospora sp. WMMD812]|uniref:DUF418 domain-containing protein n=1 Tax=Micromonospora sp. WMMD812 TaxID=3015152 RepID=UPI00248B1352|nr:DUF418 domain-containing protein [Micromonospora sp. WMMD812]WBB67938.1 DUF418 domain-containing protein [Micromonospora sp. WMMD812]